ncbi:MAG: transcriptional repressor [Bacteroidia bacterium]|nr:transcriptional repressor [Bacteroidia bacterium]
MDIRKLLNKHALRHTESRVEILQLLAEQGSALSQPEIEKAVNTCDRVTIYRTLSTCLEKGIIHKVLDDSGLMKYAICKEEVCDEKHYHSHDHVHFKCNTCGDTTCIEEVHVAPFVLPRGFIVKEVNVLIQGICMKCNP